MKQDLKVFHKPQLNLLNFWEWNPQLFREFKGKIKQRNVIIATALSVVTQLVITLSVLGELPEPISNPLNIGRQYSRYCLNSLDYSKSYRAANLCQTDLANNWIINWQLIWFDIFIALSFVGIFSLLVIGTYMLVADTVKEENRGTLNFIRLTPQSASSVLMGKLLGVPLLLYLTIALALPFHLGAGLGARIPLHLILGFDLIVVASCAFCYCLAMVWSLLNSGLGGFKPWLAGGTILGLLFMMTPALLNDYINIGNYTFEGLMLFHPGLVLSYLVDATALPDRAANFFDSQELGELLFYGRSLWVKPSLGMGFVLFNYGLWTYWLWLALQRRFHNPQSTLISKVQSYWITGWFAFMTLGFVLQTNGSNALEDNFIMWQFLSVVFFLGLIAAISPHRQTLYDWARYRHQQQQDGNRLWKELIFGENSPAVVAIAINLAIVLIYLIPSLLLFSDKGDSVKVFWGLFFGANVILFYAAIAQLVLTVKYQKRAIWSTVTTLSFAILPLVCFGLADMQPRYNLGAWLFSFMPLLGISEGASTILPMTTICLSILGQWLAIAVTNFYLSRRLKQAGVSESKMLFAQNS